MRVTKLVKSTYKYNKSTRNRVWEQIHVQVVLNSAGYRSILIVIY